METTFLYSFLPTPEPIRVSIAGDHGQASLIDLLVIINNRESPKTVDTIEVAIPVGADDGYAISTKGLNDPVTDGNRQWSFSVTGGTITITPAEGQPNKLSAPLMFTIKDIEVNHMEGNIPITVTETSPPREAKYQLTKLSADLPVKSFYAQRNGRKLTLPVLYDLDQRVQLRWECTPQGETGYTYGVRVEEGETWDPGKDFSCQDGATGVETNRLKQTTKFALDIYRVGQLHQTLYTKVHLALPSIEDLSITEPIFKGRVVKLHYATRNAVRCALKIDHLQIADNIPADTYEDGYLVPVTAAVGTHTPWVAAYGLGRVPANKDLPEFSVDPLNVIDTGVQLQSLCISADGRWALGGATGNSEIPQLTRIDLATGKADVPPIAWPVPSFSPNTYAVKSVAITPDGKLAVVLLNVTVFKKASWIIVGMGYSTWVVILDTTTWTGRGFPIVIREESSENTLDVASESTSVMAISPDGRFTFVANPWDSVTVINLASQSVERNISLDVPTAVGVTPDGRYLLAGLRGFSPGRVVVFQLPSFSQSKILYTDQKLILGMAVTSNSQNALVINADFQNVKVCALGLGAGTNVPTGAGPSSVAVAPAADGLPELAVIANADSTLTVAKVDDPSKRIDIPLDSGYKLGPIVISKTGGLNNHGVGLVATNQNKVIRFDVDELPWRKSSSGS